jgi:hypothetical protein
MGTVNRSIQSDYDRDMAAKLVANRPYPFTLTITDGKHRSTAQNRLQHMWMKEISEQKGDITPAEARAYCKLTIGVPILREQNEAFRLRYDEILKPLSYEQKLAIMSEPLNLPVTSLMSTKQLTEYLEGIIRHFGQQGIVLTMPDDMREELNTNSDDEPPAPSSDNAGMTPVNEAGADDVPASDAPASTDPERDILVRFAAEMLPMAATAPTEAWKEVEKGWSEGEMKKLSAAGLEKAKAISMSLRAIAKGNTSLESAVEYYAEVLDATVAELGGVDG